MPDAGRSLGQGIRGFRKVLDDKSSENGEPEQLPS
jgi:Sec-independent protein translocase protein TatA